MPRQRNARGAARGGGLYLKAFPCRFDPRIRRGFFAGSRFVVVGGFAKKTEKTPAAKKKATKAAKPAKKEAAKKSSKKAAAKKPAAKPKKKGK